MAGNKNPSTNKQKTSKTSKQSTREDTIQNKIREFESDSIEALCATLGIPDPLTISLKIAAGTLFDENYHDPKMRGKSIPLREIREASSRLLSFQRAAKQAPVQVEHSGTIEQHITHDISPSMAQVKELLAIANANDDPNANEHKLPDQDIIEGEVIPTDPTDSES